MDVKLLSLLTNVQEVCGLAATTEGWVILIPASLVLQGHRQHGSAAGGTRKRQVVAMRIGQELVPVGVHYQEIRDLHGLLPNA